jgi:hypothetical protein
MNLRIKSREPKRRRISNKRRQTNSRRRPRESYSVLKRRLKIRRTVRKLEKQKSSLKV